MDRGSTKTCKDTIGNRDGFNNLEIFERYEQRPSITGEQLSGSTVIRKMVDYPMGNGSWQAPDPRTVYPLRSNAQLIEDAWEALSKTNPSKAHVSIPQVIGELKDVPSLVKGYGETLLKSAATGYLSWRWCVAPMMSDIQKMATFVKASNKRFDELRHLRDGNSMRKRVSLGTAATEVVGARTLLHSNNYTQYGKPTTRFTKRVWATVQWKLDPSSDIPQMSDPDLRRFADRISAGITSHGALETAWALCPWSWFIDWFSNVGDIISATDNSVPCTWDGICVMQHTRSDMSTTLDPVGSSTWGTINGTYKHWFERKDRQLAYPAIPFPLPSLPTLDGGKLSILASLAALRR